MSGTVELFAPQAGAERIIISISFMKRALRWAVCIAASAAAISFCVVALAILCDAARPGGKVVTLYGCSGQPLGTLKVYDDGMR